MTARPAARTPPPSPRAADALRLLALGLSIHGAFLHSVARAGAQRPATPARVESLDWSRPDANRDGLAECLRLDLRLRVPPRARVLDAGSTIAERLAGDARRRLATAATPRLIAADYMLNSEATPFAVADSAGRCTLVVAFDGDSLRLARHDGQWIVSLRLLWSVGSPPDSSGTIDLEALTPPQHAARFGREWTHQAR